MSNELKVVHINEIKNDGMTEIDIIIHTKNLKVIYKTSYGFFKQSFITEKLENQLIAFIHKVYRLNSDKAIIEPFEIAGDDLVDLAKGLELATNEAVKYFSLNNKGGLEVS